MQNVSLFNDNFSITCIELSINRLFQTILKKLIMDLKFGGGDIVNGAFVS